MNLFLKEHRIQFGQMMDWGGRDAGIVLHMEI